MGGAGKKKTPREQEQDAVADMPRERPRIERGFSESLEVTYEFSPPATMPGAKKVTSERVEIIYSSRDHNPGVGYPSCQRGLARKAKSFRDNNGYYKHIGVLPTASKQEIRAKLATLYRRTHPDTGWAPDTEEFMYLREIAKVLLNDRRRERYDNLAPGEMWMDSRVKAKLREHENDAIAMGDGNPLDDPLIRGAFRRVEADPEVVEQFEDDGGALREDRQRAMNAEAAKGGYDYFAEHHRGHEDWSLAQQWYAHLVAVAPLFGYTRAVRVWLHDKDNEWLDVGGIFKIKRAWEPSDANAFALFSVLTACRHRAVGGR